MSPNFSMFSRNDAFDILLQRTAHVRSHLAFKMWARGFSLPLQAEAMLRRNQIVSGAYGDAEREFSEIAAYLDAKGLKPKRVVDIGCGHALIDLLFATKFGVSLHLVDIERTDAQHHDFHTTGAGYASLGKARAYLEANGVASSLITTTNPQRETLTDPGADIVMSLLSCGFHYPAETYGPFIDKSLVPGGLVIMDIRKSSGQDEFLRRFSVVDTIHETPKYRRIAGRPS